MGGLAAHGSRPQGLELRGIDPVPLGAAGVVQTVLKNGAREFCGIASGHTTSDFVGVLDGVTRTVFLDGYQGAPQTFPAWCRAVTVPDFQQTLVLSTIWPALRPVPEHAEFKRTRIEPLAVGEPLRVETVGRVVALTRQVALDDDWVQFSALTAALGVAAATGESDAVYGLLLANPVLTDGKTLFSTEHGNLLPAAALTADSLAAACAALAAQVAATGETLHLRAAFLLCGVKLGPTARQLVVQQTPTDPAAAAIAGALQIVQDERIPDDGRWYVTCAPTQCPTLLVARLRDEPEPVLLARDGWDVDGREYKGRDDFGVGVGNFRSMVFVQPAS